MVEEKLKIRASRTAGELEIEGPVGLVELWWNKIWPTLEAGSPAPRLVDDSQKQSPPQSTAELPEVFGEFFNGFKSDITDIDRILIAGAFVQARDVDRTFATKNANQLLLDQNIRIANPSVSTRRLIASKRAFVVSDGRFRVSAIGFDHLKSLRMASA